LLTTTPRTFQGLAAANWKAQSPRAMRRLGRTCSIDELAERRRCRESTSTASRSVLAGRRCAMLASVLICNDAQLVMNTRVPVYWLGLRRGTFTCVGWQVTLCASIWQVTSRSCEMGVPLTAIHTFNQINLLQLSFTVCTVDKHYIGTITNKSYIYCTLIRSMNSLQQSYHNHQ